MCESFSRTVGVIANRGEDATGVKKGSQVFTDEWCPALVGEEMNGVLPFVAGLVDEDI
jgi:hypothetical protein